jgi:rRNA-processing protein FCF1
VQRSIFKEKIGGEVRIPREVLKEIRKIKRKSEKRGKKQTQKEMEWKVKLENGL